MQPGRRKIGAASEVNDDVVPSALLAPWPWPRSIISIREGGRRRRRRRKGKRKKKQRNVAVRD